METTRGVRVMIGYRETGISLARSLPLCQLLLLPLLYQSFTYYKWHILQRSIVVLLLMQQQPQNILIPSPASSHQQQQYKTTPDSAAPNLTSKRRRCGVVVVSVVVVGVSTCSVLLLLLVRGWNVVLLRLLLSLSRYNFSSSLVTTPSS